MGRLSSTKERSSEKTPGGAAERSTNAEKDNRFTEERVRRATEDILERTVWDEV